MPDFLSYSFLIPLFPLLAFAAIVFYTNSNKKLSSTLAIVGIGLSWLLSWAVVAQVVSDPHALDHPDKAMLLWMPTGRSDFSIGVAVDGFTAAMLFMVPFVCTLIFIYAQGYMNPPDLHTDPRYARFFAYLSLFAFGMLTLVVSNNLLTLFMAWEIMGLCSYLLIGFWYHKPSAVAAAKKAFLTTRVGDVLLFLGMLGLYGATGTLTFSSIFEAKALEKLAAMHINFAGMAIPTASILAILIFGGAVGKSAQFPLHVWLPDAMEGPTPVSAMIHAATMVAAGVYLVARMMPIFVIGSEHGGNAMLWVGLIGAITAFFASTIALAQNDIKRVLAYSTVSQLGYMIMSLGIGGFVAAVFHMITHAFFKALLFLGSGSVIIGVERGHHLAAAAHGHGAKHDEHDAHGAQGSHDEHHGDDAHSKDAHAADAHAFDPNDMMNMGGMLQRMPITGWTYIIGTLALAGIFPLAGFWSKDEILAHAWEEFTQHGKVFDTATLPFWIWLVGSASAFLTALYMGRQLGLVFFGQPRHEAAEKAKESPNSMTFPLIVLAVFTVIVGFFNTPEKGFFIELSGAGFLHHLIGETFKASHLKELEFAAGEFNLTVAGLSTALALAGLVIGWLLYRNHRAGAADPLAGMPGFNLLKNKYYIDELYQQTVVAWTYAVARVSSQFDRSVIDATINTIGEATREIAMDLKEYFDRWVIDWLVNGVGRFSMWGGQFLRGIQTGRTQNYLMVVTFALIALAGYRAVAGRWETALLGIIILGLIGYTAYIFSRATK